jgi:predicted PurR-regulated permease PerM
MWNMRRPTSVRSKAALFTLWVLAVAVVSVAVVGVWGIAITAVVAVVSLHFLGRYIRAHRADT